MRAALLLLDLYGGEIDKVLDLGCGAGFFSLELLKRFHQMKKTIWLVLTDISPTALKLAKRRIFSKTMESFDEAEDSSDPIQYLSRKADEAVKTDKFEPAFLLTAPTVDFLHLDLRTLPQSNPFEGQMFDLLVMAQLLWGILEELEPVLLELGKALRPGGALLVSQHFPGDRQQYGRGIVKSPEDLKAYLRKAGFTELHSLETDRDTNHHYGGLWRYS
jgi:SAM-dependent methyltransferase